MAIGNLSLYGQMETWASSPNKILIVSIKLCMGLINEIAIYDLEKLIINKLE